MTIALILLSFIGLFVIGAVLHPEEFRSFLRELREGPRHQAPVDLRTGPPAGCYLDEGQGWSTVESDGTMRVGAGPVLVALLGTPDAITLPGAGDALEAGHAAASLRRGRRTVELAAVVDGHVVAVNEAVVKDPSLVARDPYGEGWLVRVSPSALAPVFGRMKAPDQADRWVRSELSRLRDVASSLAQDDASASTMLDGGLPIDGLSEHLDDDAWERLVAEVLGSPSEDDTHP